MSDRYTVTIRMIFALRWAGNVSRFNVALIVQGKVTIQCPYIPVSYIPALLIRNGVRGEGGWGEGGGGGRSEEGGRDDRPSH